MTSVVVLQQENSYQEKIVRVLHFVVLWDKFTKDSTIVKRFLSH